MNQQAPIYTRMYQVPNVFGVCENTVRAWEGKGLITIHKRGRMSFVRNEDMASIIETGCGANCGSGGE